MYYVIGKVGPNEHNIYKNYVFGPFQSEEEANGFAHEHCDPYDIMFTAKVVSYCRR